MCQGVNNLLLLLGKEEVIMGFLWEAVVPLSYHLQCHGYEGQIKLGDPSRLTFSKVWLRIYRYYSLVTDISGSVNNKPLCIFCPSALVLHINCLFMFCQDFLVTLSQFSSVSLLLPWFQSHPRCSTLTIFASLPERKSWFTRCVIAVCYCRLKTCIPGF